MTFTVQVLTHSLPGSISTSDPEEKLYAPDEDEHEDEVEPYVIGLNDLDDYDKDMVANVS